MDPTPPPPSAEIIFQAALFADEARELGRRVAAGPARQRSLSQSPPVMVMVIVMVVSSGMNPDVRIQFLETGQADSPVTRAHFNPWHVTTSTQRRLTG